MRKNIVFAIKFNYTELFYRAHRNGEKMAELNNWTGDNFREFNRIAG